MACIIKNCKSHRGIKGSDGKYISFHKFPSEKKILDQWTDAVGREPDWTPKTHHTVCSEHFTSECFSNPYVYTKHRKLTDWAVPILKLPKEPTSNLGCYPTMVILPLPHKTASPKPPTSVAKPKTTCVSSSLIDKKSDCNQCQQYKSQILELKRKLEHLEQLARKRFMRINALRQKNVRLKTKNTELQHCLDADIDYEKNMVQLYEK